MVIDRFNIVISPKPNNCKECPFWRRDDGSMQCGEVEYIPYCMFGSIESFGRFISRPIDCPLDCGFGTIIDLM